MRKMDPSSQKTTPQRQSGAKGRAQTEALLLWYAENRRDLPWRNDRRFYHVWLSEIMLQQTRVETVKEYYARFLKALPTLKSLAEADEDTYLKLWEGLGYYSRVRNLHKGAVHIRKAYHGRPPKTYEALTKIPGIGPYSAAAISSICYGEKRPAIDGNLLRIFARMTGYDRDILTTVAKGEAEAYFAELMTKLPDSLTELAGIGKVTADKLGTPAGAFNQALMDLGATVCLPNSQPLCSRCPWRRRCRAHREHREPDLPNRPNKTKKTTEEKTVLLIHYGDRIALGKRPATGLLAGLYEFPNVAGHLNQKEATAFVTSLGFGAVRIKRLPPAKHIFSHKVWDMIGYEVWADEWQAFDENVSAGPEGSGKLFLAHPKELETVWSVPGAFAFYRNHLLP